MLSPEKVQMLKKLQHLEHKWSAGFLTHGGCNVEMLQIEREIKSQRNSIKYQDVQENLSASSLQQSA